MENENLERLVRRFCTLEDEKPYIEFKHNNFKPEMIGADISALANSAALHDRHTAYMIWGINDDTHAIIGTDRDLQKIKQGKQELENWLRSMVSANADFEYDNVDVDGRQVGVLRIAAAVNQTVSFQGQEYIRIGSYTKKLNDYPEIRMKLWDKLRSVRFEEQLALKELTGGEALRKLEVGAYFDLLHISQPEETEGIVHYLLEDDILYQQDNGRLAITNMGGILLAKRLKDFPRLFRKEVRVVSYQGDSRMNMLRDETLQAGYAADFEHLITYIEALLPSREIIEGAFRRTVQMYPSIIIREAVGNALIHQDFSVSGAGPLVEIFANRLEITNPGTLLVDPLRIIDNPPKSRNEKLAALMRRMKICEELGTGWDKIVLAAEALHLPAPQIECYEESTRVTVQGEIPFAELSQEERIRACYLHACIQQAQRSQLTNQSLRERFGLDSHAISTISRVIREAVQQKWIKPVDPDTAPRYMKYIPIWA